MKRVLNQQKEKKKKRWNCVNTEADLTYAMVDRKAQKRSYDRDKAWGNRHDRRATAESQPRARWKWLIFGNCHPRQDRRWCTQPE